MYKYLNSLGLRGCEPNGEHVKRQTTSLQNWRELEMWKPPPSTPHWSIPLKRMERGWGLMERGGMFYMPAKEVQGAGEDWRVAREKSSV